MRKIVVSRVGSGSKGAEVRKPSSGLVRRRWLEQSKSNEHAASEAGDQCPSAQELEFYQEATGHL